MDADKLKDLTSVKANKNKPSARPKQAATGDYSQLYPGQQQAIDKLSDWYFSNELECTVEGPAGCGKSYIIRYFLDNIVDKSYTVTAPTHKALRVLESMVGRKGMTLHSLHGLKPNIDLQNFDIENPQFDPLNPSKIQNYNLVVIDECSMINKDLFQLNRNRATTYNVKILYVGDSLQLPPVNEEISLTFATVKNKVVLTDIVRQEEGNPLLELFSLLRDDIKNQLNMELTVLLYQNGYPPEWDEEVFEKVMEQAENFKKYAD